MTCSDFFTRFSDFYDGELHDAAAERFRRHIDDCASCRRYHRIVARGGELLRSSPPASPRSDFHDRLQHSIYLLDEERRRRRIPGGGSSLGTFAVVAAVAAAVLMTPVLWSDPGAVALPPIVVQEPPTPSLSIGSGPLMGTDSARRAAGAVRGRPSVSFEELELWTQSNTLLFQHSSLYSRHREPTVVRAGLR